MVWSQLYHQREIMVPIRAALSQWELLELLDVISDIDRGFSHRSPIPNK